LLVRRPKSIRCWGCGAELDDTFAVTRSGDPEAEAEARAAKAAARAARAGAKKTKKTKKTEAKKPVARKTAVRKTAAGRSTKKVSATSTGPEG
jgi:hypothetical protein